MYIYKIHIHQERKSLHHDIMCINLPESQGTKKNERERERESENMAEGMKNE
jgi:hypothetical protein